MRNKFLLLVVISMMIAFSGKAADLSVDGYNYTLLSAETCALAPGEYSGDIVIPDEITFKGRTLQVVDIEESVIRGNAITSVSIGKNVTHIGKYNFSLTPNLKSLTIPGNVMQIESLCFYECGIELLIIEKSTSSLRVGASETPYYDQPAYYTDGTFTNCPNLQKVIINRALWVKDSDNLILKRTNPFEKNTSLKEVEFDVDLTVRETAYFANCSNLERITIGPNVTSINPKLCYSCNLQELNIPGNVKSIDEEAFGNNQNLRKLTIEEGVEAIYTFAFSNCPKVTELVIPSTIKDGNFIGLSGVKELTILVPPTSKIYNVPISAVEKLTFGPLYNSFSGSNYAGMSNLKEIHVQNLIPPTVTGEFAAAQYLNTVVYVPFQSLEEYKAAPIWKNFWSFEGEEYSGIKSSYTESKGNIEVSKGRICANGDKGNMYSVFDSNGRMIYKGSSIDLMGLSSGLYVVKTSTTATKIFVP